MQDCTARVWDLEAGTSLHSLEGALRWYGILFSLKFPESSLVFHATQMRIKSCGKAERCVQAMETSSAARRWRRMGPL